MRPASRKTTIDRISKIALCASIAIALSIIVPIPAIDGMAFATTSASLSTDDSANSDPSSITDEPEHSSEPDNPGIPNQPSEPEKPAVTQVGGLITEKALLPSRTMSDTISISPAEGRKVLLQKKTTSGEWKTIRTYTCKNASKAKVTLSYPSSQWKYSKRTTWRISLPETSTAKAYTSKNIMLYTQNRKTLSINAKSAVLMNANTGRVLYRKNMSKKRGQASITKVMTAILAIENNRLSKKAKITKNAANTPWTYVPISKGNRVTVRNLLYASLLPSSNGSATALAEATSGSVSKFAKMMNKKAKAIGMKNTRYKNAHGLTQTGHYSTAYDTALLMSYAIKNPTFRKIAGTRQYVFKNASNGKRYKLTTTNRLLKQHMKGVIGGKTGTTDAAGCCFTCAYKYKGQTYIAVILGATNTDARFNDARKLINYAKKYGW